MSSTYPTDTDLKLKIESLGVVDTTGCAFTKIDLGRKVAAAIAQWEKRTGWTPFLAAQDAEGVPVETTRLFDAPDGRVLSLRGGVVSVSAVSVFGSDYELGSDCYLQPGDAPSKNKPYTEIRFLYRIASRLPQCVSVTGVWGYGLELGDDVFEAILDQAAALCVPEIALGISGGYYERKIGDSLKRFGGTGTTPLSAEKEMWEANFVQTAKDKKRITV